MFWEIRWEFNLIEISSSSVVLMDEVLLFNSICCGRECLVIGLICTLCHGGPKFSIRWIHNIFEDPPVARMSLTSSFYVPVWSITLEKNEILLKLVEVIQFLISLLFLHCI